MRDRAWLRQIVNLWARAREEHISSDVIELQEDTVLAALEILDHEPGVLLADEVGMGKTFQTLAIIACALQERPKARVLVVTPTPQLNEQWYWYGHRFREHGFYPFAPEKLAVAQRLTDLPALCRKHNIVFAPITIFIGARAHQELGFLFQLWARHRKLSARAARQLEQRIRAAGVPMAAGTSFLGRTHRDFKRAALVSAFRRAKGDRGFAGLDDLLDEGPAAFDSAVAVRRALDRARFVVLGTLMGALDILVVDEAHKLKNPWSVRAQAVAQVLAGIYQRAVFITATPFQLGVEELRQVFQLFASARDVRPGFAADVQELHAAVREYQRTYERFETLWRYVDEPQARAFAQWYGMNERSRTSLAEIADANVRVVGEEAERLLALKRDRVEPAFRRFTIRSLKPSRRARRLTRLSYLPPADGAVVPMLLHQRLLSLDGARRGGTELDINMASSYQAAAESRLLREPARDPEVRAYQKVARAAVKSVQEEHPKLAYVVTEVVEAALAGEKTLIFCERNSSIRLLERGIEQRWYRELVAAWNRVCPGYTFEQVFGAGDGREPGIGQRIPPRFYRGNDELSVALAESYLHTVFRPELGVSDLRSEFWRASGQVLQRADELLATCRVPIASSVRIDYQVAARCIDQAVAEWFVRARPALRDADPIIAHLLAPDYPSAGFGFTPSRAGERYRPSWKITAPVFNAIVAPKRMSIWFPFRGELARLPLEVRWHLVEAVRYFLTRREVPFLVELVQRIADPKASSERMRDGVEIWWAQRECRWRDKVQELLDYLPCLTVAEQKEVLGSMLHSPRVVQNLLAARSRTLRQNAFNAPFYPLVAIGNQTIQQGLDLHRQCRRVVHYDLRWNPADIEQRIGRVERHGSLAERYRPDDADGKVQVIFPLLAKTNDTTLYRDIRLRERWMEFWMGTPEARRGDSGQPLPQGLINDLRIELGPRREGAATGRGAEARPRTAPTPRPRTTPVPKPPP